MRPLYLFLLFGLFLSILFSSGQIENPDTHLRLTQARSIIQEGKFGLADDVGEDLHGNISINKNGQRYMVYNPGQTVVFIPIYSLVRLICSDEAANYYISAFCVSFINYFVHALCAYFLFQIALLLGASVQRAFMVSAFFGLTSYSFVFAQSTYEHHFEMLFILMSMKYALSNKNENSGTWLGLIISLGLFFRTTTILAVPAILLIQKGTKDRFKALLGISVGSIFVLLYNYYRFGDPFESGYSLAWSLAHGSEVDFWSISNLSVAIYGFLFSPGKGLIFFSTTVLIAILGARTFWNKNRRMSQSVLLIAMTYLIVFSLNFAWHGSVWSYGPRYILPIVPFLYLPIMYVKPKRWLLYTMIVAFIFQVGIISVNYKRDVLEDFTTNNGLSDLEYLLSIEKEPHFAQAKQLAIILPKNLEKLNNYQPSSVWKKETRTASNREVIRSSIEKNSINFWWVRVFHWKLSIWIRVVSLIILASAIIGSIVLIRYVRRKSE